MLQKEKVSTRLANLDRINIFLAQGIFIQSDFTSEASTGAMTEGLLSSAFATLRAYQK